MTVIVHFVHNIILPHIFERKLYLMQDVVDDSFIPKNRKPKPIPKPAAMPQSLRQRASMSN